MDMRELTVREEVEYLRELYGSDREVLARLTDAYTVIQGRAQMLLSLIALCLTITGFSGPKIAAASAFCRYSIVFGLGFVLIAALLLISGPLQLRWVTRYKADRFEDTVAHLIRRRNGRSHRYLLASLALVIGLTGYVGSVIAFLLGG